MPEVDEIFANKLKFKGALPFEKFYVFCYDFLKDETGLPDLIEKKYKEKLSGDSKNLEIEWQGTKKMTDFFKFKIKLNFLVIGLKKVEVMEGNKKVKMDEGEIEMKLVGELVRDYKGMFEKNWFQKMWRAFYEKVVIPARIEQFEDKIFADCDEFFAQVKAYLNLEGKR